MHGRGGSESHCQMTSQMTGEMTSWAVHASRVHGLTQGHRGRKEQSKAAEDSGMQ